MNDLLYSGTYLFVGAPKVGKSFFMGQLAYHVAMGLPLWEYEVQAENSQLYAMKRDFRRVWNYFGAEKVQQVIGLMREQEQNADRSQKKNRQNSVEL